MNIAWFAPFNTGGAVGQYGAALLDALLKEHRVTVFTEHDARRLPLHEATAALSGYDALFYNVGFDDTDMYPATLELSRCCPGIVVLHGLPAWIDAAAVLPLVRGAHGAVVHSQAEADALSAVAPFPVQYVPLPDTNMSDRAAESARLVAALAAAVQANRPVLRAVDFITGEMRRMGAGARFPHFPATVTATLESLFVLDQRPS